MRIEKLIMKNYRQFKDVEISFEKSKNDDIHVFIGDNGTGKTNILNAINWCLYYDEPHLSRDSQQLPPVNMGLIEETNDSEEKQVKVELWTKTNNSRNIIFSRIDTYRLYKDKREPYLQRSEFYVIDQDKKGNSKIKRDLEAKKYVDRFIPKAIREFFLFDGERLDRFFKEIKNVSFAIEDISQIELLKRIGYHLRKLIGDMRREAGRINPEIENVTLELEKKEEQKIELERRMEEDKTQIIKAKNEIDECNEVLRGRPDVEKLQSEREKLLTDIDERNKRINEKKEERRNLLFKNSKLILLWSAISKAIKLILEKKRKKEIPPTVDKSFLQEIIKNKKCYICGNSLSKVGEKNVKNMLKKVKSSSEVAQKLTDIDYYLKDCKSQIIDFGGELEDLQKDIDVIEKDVKSFETRVSEIDNDLRRYNVEEIKGSISKLNKFEHIRDKRIKALGIFESKEKETNIEIDELKRNLDKGMKKEEKAKNLQKRVSLCEKALKVIEKVEENIKNEMRKNIEKQTKKLFLDLIWKKRTFKDVHIDQDYCIKLIHKVGRDCMGSISGGEREVLTLAFTIALHNVSGFDSPIIIDRPLVNVAGEPRINVVNTLCKVSKNKQVILFFTPHDYSEEISEILDPEASSRYRLYMLAHEDETIVEEL